MKRLLLDQMIENYCCWLIETEKSSHTIERYSHYLQKFRDFTMGKPFDKSTVLLWKEQIKQQFAPITVNSALAALNGLFKFLGWLDLTTRYLKIKKNVFCSEEKELKRKDYESLVRTAFQKSNERLAMLMQTICTTGIRVSELKFITVEAAEKKYATVECKGGFRTVFLPTELCKQLKTYAKNRKIDSGMIFVTRTGRAMDRSNIWREMKLLSRDSGVNPEKIFPHNLRHLFARVYYSQQKDLSRLADILGHSSVNTTKIYTIESGGNHMKQIERMNLIISDYNRISLLL